MPRFLSRALWIALFLLPSAAFASDPRPVSWGDLAPPSAEIENPFESLTPAQMDALRLVLRFESRADQGDDPEAQAEAEAMRGQLGAEGIDVDALFQARLDIIAHREKAAAQVNPDIVGQAIRMPGYVLPLTLEGRRATEFLLVPTVGACVHTPPPAPNQIVHVVYPGGVEVGGLFTPVWITGVMAARSSVQNVGFSDGRAAVTVSYTMHPDDVMTFDE